MYPLSHPFQHSKPQQPVYDPSMATPVSQGFSVPAKTTVGNPSVNSKELLPTVGVTLPAVL